MTTPPGAFHHYLPYSEQASHSFWFRPPGILVLHHHFIDRHTGFPAPVKQVFRGINRKGQLYSLGSSSLLSFLFYKTTTYGVIGFSNGVPILYCGQEGECIWMIRKCFSAQEF